jgi:hypothetical protein
VPIYEIYINTTGEYEPPSPSTTADDDGIQIRQTNLILEVPASGSLLIGATSNRMIYTILPSPSIITITTFRNNYDLLNLTAFSSIHSLDDLQYTNLSSPLTLLLPLVRSSSSTMTARSIGIQQQIIFLSRQSLDLTTDSILFASAANDDHHRRSRSGSGQVITSSTTYISALVVLIILLLVLTIGFVWFVRKYFHESLVRRMKLTHPSFSSQWHGNDDDKDNHADLEARSHRVLVEYSVMSAKADTLFIVDDIDEVDGKTIDEMRSNGNDDDNDDGDSDEDDADEDSYESFLFNIDDIPDEIEDDPNSEDYEKDVTENDMNKYFSTSHEFHVDDSYTEDVSDDYDSDESENFSRLNDEEQEEEGDESRSEDDDNYDREGIKPVEDEMGVNWENDEEEVEEEEEEEEGYDTDHQSIVSSSSSSSSLNSS